MIVKMRNNLVRFIVLDISGVYSQIYDEGYVTKDKLYGITEKYLDTEHWRVLLINN